VGLHPVARPGLSFQIDATIDLGCLRLKPSFEPPVAAIEPLDQDFLSLSHQGSIFLQGDSLLKVEKSFQSFCFHTLGNWIRKPRGRGPFLRGIFESA